MNTLPNRPDRKRNRLLGFDYRASAFYFVTSCVKEMACVFGEVVDDQMHLSPYGKIAEHQWVEMLAKLPYLRSHAFVVMPNHVHGLLEIKSDHHVQEEADVNRDILSREELRSDGEREVSEERPNDGRAGGVHQGGERECAGQECMRTGQALSLPGTKIKSLSQVVGAFKSNSSRLIRLAGLTKFAWQRSFHDHIIRDEKGFHNIKEYIENNPANWSADRFNKL